MTHPQFALHIPHKNGIVVPDCLWGVINDKLEPLFQFPIMMARSFMAFKTSTLDIYNYAIQFGTGNVVVYRWTDFNSDLETFNTGYVATTSNPITLHEDSTHLYVNVIESNSAHIIYNIDKATLLNVGVSYNGGNNPNSGSRFFRASDKFSNMIYEYNSIFDTLTEFEMTISNPGLVTINTASISSISGIYVLKDTLPKLAIDFNGQELVFIRDISKYYIFKVTSHGNRSLMFTINTGVFDNEKAFGVLTLGNNKLLLVEFNHTSNITYSIIIDVSSDTYILNGNPSDISENVSGNRPIIKNISQLNGDSGEIYAVSLMGWQFNRSQNLSLGLFKWNASLKKLEYMSECFPPASNLDALTPHTGTFVENESYVSPSLTQVKLF